MDLDLSASPFTLPQLQRLAIASQPFMVTLPAMTSLSGLRELYVGGARWCARFQNQRFNCTPAACNRRYAVESSDPRAAATSTVL